jgi:hypothetical protein
VPFVFDGLLSESYAARRAGRELLALEHHGRANVRGFVRLDWV